MADERLLSEDQVALVFRRAAELDAASPERPDGFDAATLERIGAEAGLSPAAVRRALDELRSGRLERAVPPESPTTVPRRHTIERVVPADPAIASERLEAFLRSQVLRVCRRLGTLSVWEPSRSLGANLVRGIDLTDRMRLARVDGVELQVEATDGGSFVRVTLDLARMHRNVRSGRWAAAGIGTTGVAIAGAGLALGAPEALLVMPATIGTSLGSYFGTRSTYAKHLKRALDAVELVLDELEHGGG